MSLIPFVVHESKTWCLVHKPHKMPTAPLHENEENTLVSWFLSQYPEGFNVKGRKSIEKGLIHRLDTDTSGLVLFALNQNTFDIFLEAQKKGEIIKNYHAFCSIDSLFDQSILSKTPFLVTGRFKAWGPGRKKVRTVQIGMKGYEKAGEEYNTRIISITHNANCYSVSCELSKGFRHQVRVHLSDLGLPIMGDVLYNTNVSLSTNCIPLQLHAIGISFFDPDSLTKVSFSLPPPDKMTQ